MHLLLINPNTTSSITDQVARVARAAVSPGVAIDAVTGRFGARYIASRAAAAVAGHAALDAWAEHAAAHDAVVLACFGDPGLDALRELAPVPVVGMAEASIHAACLLGRRFAIVTGGERWVAMLEEFVAARGLAGRLSGIHAVAATGAAIAADPDAALDGLAAACAEAVRTGAESVILGGAGLAGLAARIGHRVPVPLVDCAVAAVRLAETLVALAPRKAAEGSHAFPAPVESAGLGPGLAARLAGPGRGPG